MCARMSLSITRLSSPLRLRIEPAQPAPADLADAIEQAWAAELSRRPQLTNGALLAFVRWESGDLVARRTDYRHFIAQRRYPRLFAELHLRTLAVSGLTRHDGELLFGLRSGAVTHDAHRWELVPSGGIVPRAGGPLDSTLVADQCCEELEEETGIPRSSVVGIEAFVAVEDPEAHVIDIGVELSVRDFRATLPRSDEYDRLVPVPIASLPDFCRSHDVIPVSRALLESRGLLTG
jgi:hypothetical protein